MRWGPRGAFGDVLRSVLRFLRWELEPGKRTRRTFPRHPTRNTAFLRARHLTDIAALRGVWPFGWVVRALNCRTWPVTTRGA